MTSDAISLFILAGEPSGDRIAADLVKGLKRTTLRLSGVGGAALMAEGLSPLFPMAEDMTGALLLLRSPDDPPFNAFADVRSVPKGFSTTNRRHAPPSSLSRPVRPSSRAIGANASGGVAK